MHTIKVEIKETHEYRVHHNTDWSGDAIIARPNGSQVTIPGQVILAAVKDLIEQHGCFFCNDGSMSLLPQDEKSLITVCVGCLRDAGKTARRRR